MPKDGAGFPRATHDAKNLGFGKTSVEMLLCKEFVHVRLRGVWPTNEHFKYWYHLNVQKIKLGQDGHRDKVSRSISA